MLNDTNNPYASPAAAPGGTPASDEAAQLDWKSVLRRWEVLRLPYNLIVGVTGLISLIMFPSVALGELMVVVGIVLYGIGANVCFFFGPIAELYINWFADTWGKRFFLGQIFNFSQSKVLTWFLFTAGTLFSVLLTLFIGLVGALAGLEPHGVIE
jgi:hypothetical protein